MSRCRKGPGGRESAVPVRRDRGFPTQRAVVDVIMYLLLVFPAAEQEVEVNKDQRGRCGGGCSWVPVFEGAEPGRPLERIGIRCPWQRVVPENKDARYHVSSSRTPLRGKAGRGEANGLADAGRNPGRREG